MSALQDARVRRLADLAEGRQQRPAPPKEMGSRRGTIPPSGAPNRDLCHPGDRPERAAASTIKPPSAPRCRVFSHAPEPDRLMILFVLVLVPLALACMVMGVALTRWR